MISSDPYIIGADSETTLISEFEPIPRAVCFAVDDGDERGLYAESEPDGFEAAAMLIVHPDNPPVCLHNAAFDLAVVMRAFPYMAKFIFASLDAGRIHCTLIREKLLNLASHGNIDFKPVMPGSPNMKTALYDLAYLVKDRLGKDISAGKGEDSWRTRYAELIGVPLAEWPKEAVEYAADDPGWCRQVYLSQERDRRALEAELGMDPLASHSLRVAMDFALALATAWGMPTRPEVIRVIEAEVEADRDPFRVDEDGKLVWGRLFSPDIWTGIEENGVKVWAGFKAETLAAIAEADRKPLIDFPVEPQPYANGAKEHLPECPGHKDHPEKKSKKIECMCPPKMKEGRAEKKNKKALESFIEALSIESDEIELWRNEPTAKMIEEAQAKGQEPIGNVCANKEWLETFAHFDETLDQFNRRKKLDKLVTDYLPKLHVRAEDGKARTDAIVDRVFFPFNCLVRTGRTSSRSSDHYPSMNGQQMDPRVRKGFRPDEGYLLASWDFKAMELCTAAQTCLWSVGESELARLINAGVDTHLHLGGPLAFRFDEGFSSDFASIGQDDFDGLREALASFKGIKDECPYPWARRKAEKDGKAISYNDFFKGFRTFAKPTNLGYPGGLGVKTFVGYAKSTYGVTVSMEESQACKDIWMQVYPEFPKYFKWMTANRVDYRSGKSEKQMPDGSVRKSDRYWYSTPFGMIRSGCDYCAAMNGNALQSPSTEGAALGFYEVTKACHGIGDAGGALGPDSKGFRAKPVNFVHDEIMAMIREDSRAEVDVRVAAVSAVMERTFASVTPDVKATAEPALMRTCWIKAAEEARDENGFIIPWDDVPSNMALAKEKGWV